VVYTRQSLDRSGDGLAVARQREDCLKLCRDRGWTVAQTVTDNDISASNGKLRPGFVQVLRMVDDRATDVVVVWAVDRLVRKLADLEDVIERCERAGVRLATVSGDIDLSTDSGRLVGRILASVARGEMERKGARQRRANAQAAETGKPTQWAHRPFGYQADKITLVPTEAHAVADACEQLLSGGSLRSIAQQWNAAKLAPPQGAPQWKGQTVKAVLGNPRVGGLSAYKGEIVGAGSWPALVPEPTWRAVRTLLDDPARRPRTRGVRTLLGGVARCYCGAPAYGTRNSLGAPAYRCRVMSGTRMGPGSTGHVTRLAGVVDDYVTELVIERLSRPDAADLLIDHDRPDVEALRGQARALRARLEELGEEFAAGELPAAQLRRINERIATQLSEIETELADAGRVSVLGGLVGIADARAAWEGLDLDRRRAVIDTLMRITLFSPGRGARVFDPDTVSINWKEQQ
jgi:site-specific DNA recombinase